MLAGAATDAANIMSALSQLAWPVAVVILVLVFRRTIAEQAGRIQALKAGGAELTFAERVNTVVKESGDLPESVVDEVSAGRQAYLLRLAANDPATAIKKAWEVVREAAQSVARRRNVQWTSTKDLVGLLQDEGGLESSVVQLVLNLRSLRYDATDQTSQELTPATATAYVAAASTVAGLLRKLDQDD